MRTKRWDHSSSSSIVNSNAPLVSERRSSLICTLNSKRAFGDAPGW